jgi:hypothetical protein
VFGTLKVATIGTLMAGNGDTTDSEWWLRMHMRLHGSKPLVGMAAASHDAVDLTPNSGEGLVIDACDLTFASPLDLAAMVAAAHVASTTARPVALRVPSDRAVAAYLQRMDIARRLPSSAKIEGSFPSETRAHLMGSLLEVTRLDAGSAEDVGARLGRLVTEHFPDTRGRHVFGAVGELLDNAASHGVSDTGAFVAAQTYTGKTSGSRGFEVAVADTGMGVLAHLRQNPDFTGMHSAAQALAAALEPGVSGEPNDRGYGLGDLIGAAAASGQIEFHLRSGDAGIRVTGFPPSAHMVVLMRRMTIVGTWAWLRVAIP